MSERVDKRGKGRRLGEKRKAILYLLVEAKLLDRSKILPGTISCKPSLPKVGRRW